MFQLVDRAYSVGPKQAATHRLRLTAANSPVALLRTYRSALQCDHCCPDKLDLELCASYELKAHGVSLSPCVLNT